MFIGAYLCGSGLVYLALLVLLVVRAKPQAAAGNFRKRLTRYSFVAAGLSAAGLVAFLGLSAAAGLLRLGQAGSYSLPDDYVALGAAGWLIMLVGLAGLLSPLAAVFLTRWSAAGP